MANLKIFSLNFRITVENFIFPEKYEAALTVCIKATPMMFWHRWILSPAEADEFCS